MNIALKIAAALAASLSLAAAANEEKIDCPQLMGAKPQVQMEYLQDERPALTDACMIYAMDQLGKAAYAPAVSALVKLLDYRIPDPPKTNQAFVQVTVPWLGTWYPAARGLLTIGKSAVPALVAAIADAATSDRIRANATEMVLLIYRADTPEGAAVLNRAGRAATDSEAQRRLLDAARDLAAKCVEPRRAACLANALK